MNQELLTNLEEILEEDNLDLSLKFEDFDEASEVLISSIASAPPAAVGVASTVVAAADQQLWEQQQHQ